MRSTALFLALAAAFPSSFAAPVAGTRATLAILETTDLHANVLSYDYFKLAHDQSFGLERTATLIAQARREFPNTLLFDDGDTIQGTALGDYEALVRPIGCDETLAVYKAMNRIGYDGASIGNHDFNFGLAYLRQVTGSRFDVPGLAQQAKACAGPNFPLVLANVYSVKTKQPIFAPYRIIDKTLQALDKDGKPVTATIRVGIIGFTPPGIMAWDKRWLEGRVYTEGIRETALKYIPEMRAQGADLIVAVSHGGLDNAPYSPQMENANWYLAQIPGAPIDAMLTGHSHQVFPNEKSTVAMFNLPGVDKVHGTVHGVPTVMANLWGKHLGVIRFEVAHDGHGWVVDKAQTKVEARSIQGVAPDPEIAKLIAGEHAATIAYVKTPVGSSEERLSTFFADVGDSAAVAVVNMAQADYVKRYIAANLPQYAQLPVLSVSAPFKSGAAGPSDYTDVPAGPLALNNAADLYLYPNTLTAVKVTGAQLKAWLERGAERFNRIDPARSEPQELVNTSFSGFNFDMVTSPEVRYEIDVTQPVGQRIRGLAYHGKPVVDAQEFIVATNNYRATGGGNFPGLNGSNVVIASPDANHDVLIAWLKQEKTLTRAALAQQRSWTFAKVKTAGPVVFHSAPAALPLVQQAGLANVVLLKQDDGSGKGFALYSLDLSR
ncbi:bifunctional 2',3'-cyclic-nucleotide 2'-phosphodiesterase/3'-nucleotidase [Zemynaea arenosa]|nr:bifunctional 2',3'-cyclic-nucleotide 2'-phosphodiesterase/3'-nucleotidase [Massilia arenosa]